MQRKQAPRTFSSSTTTPTSWMIAAVLRNSYDVVTAQDGLQAVAVLEKQDVAGIIADHMMPGMTGVELLDRGHELRPAAARILITASDRVNVLRDAVNRARVHRFLSKPLRLTELPATLADAIREAWLEAENARLVTELARKNDELNQINGRLEVEVRERTHELRVAIQQLEELALRDGLTGLFNHRFLQEALDAELSRARRHGHPVSLLFIDVDHFKQYNDRHGHPAGDRLLKRIADVLVGGRNSGLPRAGARIRPGGALWRRRVRDGVAGDRPRGRAGQGRTRAPQDRRVRVRSGRYAARRYRQREHRRRDVSPTTAPRSKR